MSNINNKNKNLFAIDAVQDIDNETAATCSGGEAPDVLLYEHPNAQGQALAVNAASGQGVRYIGDWINDKTSSIVINRGEWTFFEDANYNINSHTDRLLGILGKAQTVRLGPGHYNLGANDDMISSLRREK